jgi:hypothetical protein
MNGLEEAHGRADVHVPVTPGQLPGENPSSMTVWNDAPGGTMNEYDDPFAM